MIDFAETLQRAQAQRDALDDALSGLATLRGRGESADGQIVAEVSAQGKLVALEIADAVTRLPAREVSELILEATNRAAAAAAESRLARYAELGRAFGATDG
ncbi:YbaB/EbfC family nucleoid-associated protein [Lolliginicoccus suaedae]|uniref:YbaB/EbfC family nucleoid-associated protein n=1 Tax=Lolliginicoccus suaedae TaxID=2605429 RepID=UPI001659EDCB|nr:YbaB/EbfC family nucleoid-associated protein [Lolliginicoccus suaedae]